MGTSKIKKLGAVQRKVLDIPANTYNTYALALEAMYTAWEGLSGPERYNSFIVVGSSAIRFNPDLMTEGSALYNRISCDNATSAISVNLIHLKSHTYSRGVLSTTGYTTADYSSNAQANSLKLYTIC